MDESFAAIWTHGQASPHIGSVRVCGEGLHFCDHSPRSWDDRVVRLARIDDARIADPPERLADLNTLVVELVTGRQVRIAALGRGATLELAGSVADARG